MRRGARRRDARDLPGRRARRSMPTTRCGSRRATRTAPRCSPTTSARTFTARVDAPHERAPRAARCGWPSNPAAFHFFDAETGVSLAARGGGARAPDRVGTLRRRRARPAETEAGPEDEARQFDVRLLDQAAERLERRLRDLLDRLLDRRQRAAASTSARRCRRSRRPRGPPGRAGPARPPPGGRRSPSGRSSRSRPSAGRACRRAASCAASRPPSTREVGVRDERRPASSRGLEQRRARSPAAFSRVGSVELRPGDEADDARGRARAGARVGQPPGLHARPRRPT